MAFLWPTYYVWPIHKQSSVFTSVKDIHSIWPLSQTFKVLQRLQSGREKHLGCKGRVFYLNCMASPCEQTLLLWDRLCFPDTWPGFRLCRHSRAAHLAPNIPTSIPPSLPLRVREGVRLNSSCRCERRGNLGPLCETKQLHFILNWELGTWTNSPLSSSSYILETWEGKVEVSNAWTVSIYWSLISTM